MQLLKKILRNPWVVIFLVLLIDQSVKIWVKTHMLLGQDIPVFGHWFSIHFVENNGMAFGLQFGGIWGKYLLTIFRIIAVLFIGFYLARLRKKKETATGLLVSFALIFAGALGNIIDSVFYGVIFNQSYTQIATLFPAAGGYAGLLQGRVVDMLYFPLYNGFLPHWIPFVGGDYFQFFRPVFNISDSAITIGILMLLLFNKRYFKPKEKDTDTANAVAADNETELNTIGK